MSLVTETGAGSPTAESFASVADYKAYCDGRGVDYSTLSDTDIEQRLRKATDYMEEAYRERWTGYRTSTTQALSWPRYNVPMRDAPAGFGYSFYPSDALPQIVVKACVVLAIKAGDGDLNPDQTQAVKRKKVGQVEIEFQDYTSAATAFTAVDDMLAPVLGAGGGIQLVRA